MAYLDVEALLTPISSDSPCGENMEYDPLFSAMEQASQGKPEQQYGDTIIPAEPPEWKKLRESALAVLQRSRDLWAAVYLCQAATNLHGVGGLSEGLAIIHGLLERYWEEVNPPLDPDDPDDPAAFRISALMGLTDRNNLLRPILEVPIVAVRTIGSFNLREMRLANGTAKPSGEETVPDEAVVRAAFRETDLAALQALQQYLTAAVGHVDGIIESFNRHLGVGQGPDLKPLHDLLKSALITYRDYLPANVQSEEASAPEEEGSEASGVSKSAAGFSVKGEIANADDALRLLDKIIAFYKREQPASPVPLLLTRARRLATMNFLEILRDIAPDGIDQAERVVGREPEANDD